MGRERRPRWAVCLGTTLLIAGIGAGGVAHSAPPPLQTGYGSAGAMGLGLGGVGAEPGAALGAIGAGPTIGPGLHITPSLEVREIYADNITLAGPGQERSDFVTEVNPQISLSKQARRFDLLANYRMQNIFYARNSASDATFHQLYSHLDAELWPNMFSFGAAATASQALVSPSQPVALSNVSITDNRTNVVTYSATPRFHHAFGRWLVTQAFYTYSAVDYNTQQFSGSQTREYGVSIGTGPDVPKVQFSLIYNRSRTNFDAFPDVTFQHVEAEARYPADEEFRIVLRGGYENNNFQFGPTVSQPKGKIWSGGFEWDMSPKTFVEASYGRRFFGPTIAASFRHEGAWTSAAVSYTEEPSTISALALAQQPLVLGPNGQFIQVLAPSLPALSAEVFINRQLSATLGAHGVRDHISATISRSERTFEIAGSKETVTGVDAAWTRRLGAYTTSDIAGYWQREQFIGGSRTDELWEVRGALRYRFGIHAYGSLSVTHTQRNSDAASDYFVNMVALGITVGF